MDDDLIHPGEILGEEFLKPLGISQTRLAADLGVPYRRINEVVRCKRAITAETALLLARYFNNSPEFWMNLQVHFDLQRSARQVQGKLERVRSLPGSAVA